MVMRFFAAKARPAVYPWEETVNKIAVRHFALITAAAVLLVVISAHIARASSSLDSDKYIHPSLAADGVTSDDVALAKAAAACDAAGTRLVLPAGKILLTGVGRLINAACGFPPPPKFRSTTERRENVTRGSAGLPRI